MRVLFIAVVAVGLLGCESEGDAAGGDSTSRFERGMERVGESIENAAADVGTEVSETRIQMILDNIKGMDSVQAEITGEASVTLIGSVASEEARSEAERLVRSNEGVTSVRNAIAVGGATLDTSAASGTGAATTGDDTTRGGAAAGSR